jgi:hypothetical protein
MVANTAADGRERVGFSNHVYGLLELALGQSHDVTRDVHVDWADFFARRYLVYRGPALIPVYLGKCH